MGHGLMRFSKHPIACVIDAKFNGKTVREAIGLEHDIPIVATIDEALKKGSEILVLGIAPSGGKFPKSWEGPRKRTFCN